MTLVSAPVSPREMPPEIAQLRALIGVQAMAIEALTRRLAAMEARVADLAGLLVAVPDADKRTGMADLARMIEVETGIAVATLRSADRTRPVFYARAMFCGAARRAGWSLPQIGAFLGRDHTTVLSAARMEATAREWWDSARASAPEVAA